MVVTALVKRLGGVGAGELDDLPDLPLPGVTALGEPLSSVGGILTAGRGVPRCERRPATGRRCEESLSVEYDPDEEEEEYEEADTLRDVDEPRDSRRCLARPRTGSLFGPRERPRLPLSRTRARLEAVASVWWLVPRAFLRATRAGDLPLFVCLDCARRRARSKLEPRLAAPASTRRRAPRCRRPRLAAEDTDEMLSTRRTWPTVGEAEDPLLRR